MKHLMFGLLLVATPVHAETTIIRSTAGATARVAASAASSFRSYIAALEAHGAVIHALGGVRRGACRIPRSKHPCGLALDVCQLSRGRVDARCRLPSRQVVGEIANSLGLVEGGGWRNSDYGHVEVRTTRQAEPNYSPRTLHARTHTHERPDSATHSRRYTSKSKRNVTRYAAVNAP